MKTLFLTFGLATLLTIACKAQQPVAKLNISQVKSKGEIYNIKKTSVKLTKISVTTNKLSNIKPIAPKLPSDVMMPDYMIVDKKLLTKICADAIPLSILKKSPMGYNDYLFIKTKINTKGEPLEVEFLLNNNSLLTILEIQEIEQKIKTLMKVSFKMGVERYFEGANYFNVYTTIQYSEMLKFKESK